ncbi:aldo/keto reductase [Microbacterium pumilum]|uniref:NADP-dependent oxidoreductase domain-containing protein n=1 Tax=Microbacterium pumilum TaxID=344165 RepID=A0ABP5D5E5_9MICO
MISTRLPSGSTIQNCFALSEHLHRLLAETTVVPAVNQIELHPYFSQKDVQTLHAEHGILTQAWSPIGGITIYRPAAQSALDDATLKAIGEAHGKTPAQVTVRWHIQQGRSAIPKSTKAARIAENFDVFDFELSNEELAVIDALDTGVRGGPPVEVITRKTFAFTIPEA